MLASEQILKITMATYNGRSPPLGFLIGAWANTAHYISETIRIGQRTPAETIGNLGAWEHMWGWTPAFASNGGEVSSGPPEPDDRALKNQLNSMRGQVKRLQSASVAPERSRRRDEGRDIRPATAVLRGRQQRDDGGADDDEAPVKRKRAPRGKGTKAGNK